MGFVTTSRVKEFIPNFPSADDTVLSHIVDAVCTQVESYCKRTFSQATYDELYSGTQTRSLFVKNIPVSSVASVRYGLRPALAVTNSSQNIQAATVQVTDTALVLYRLAGGASTTTTLTYATYTTVGSLNSAINALSAAGWASVTSDDLSGWQSSDLAGSAQKGALSARQNTANVLVHFWYANDYRWTGDTGEVWTPGGWPMGEQNIRIAYTAGYSTIPDDLQQAVAEIAAQVYAARRRNPNLQSETIGAYSYTNAVMDVSALWGQITPLSMRTINSYRLYSIPRWESNY